MNVLCQQRIIESIKRTKELTPLLFSYVNNAWRGVARGNPSFDVTTLPTIPIIAHTPTQITTCIYTQMNHICTKSTRKTSCIYIEIVNKRHAGSELQHERERGVRTLAGERGG